MTTASNSLGETGVEAARALQIIESMAAAAAWAADAAGRFTYITPGAAAFIGSTLGDLNSSLDGDVFGWSRVVHPDDYERVAASWRHCVQTGDPYDTELRMRRADGVYLWFKCSGRASRDSQGNITAWHGTTFNIDNLKRVEAALRDRERELSQLVDMVPSHVWRLMPDGAPIFFNKRMVDYLGLDVADMDRPGMSRLDALIETVHPDDAAEFGNSLRRCLATGESLAMRYRLRRADGAYRWAECRVEPRRGEDGAIAEWYGVSLDIDDEVRAQEALRERDRELSQIVDMVPVHIRRLTPEGNPTFFNKRLIDFFGLKDLADCDKPGMSRLAAAIGALVHPDDAASLLETVRHSIATGEPYSMKYRMRHASGAYRWVDGRAEPLRDQSGAIVQWYAISIDIDDEMRAQEALRNRERELWQLVDMAPSLIWRLTPDGEPTFFNKRMVDFHAMDVADLDKPGMSRLDAVLETVHPDDVAEYRDALNHCLITGEPFSMRYRVRRADGVYRWMSSRAEPMRDQDGRIIQWYGLCHDIDDQTRLYSEIAEREARIRRLIVSDIIGIVIWDLDGTLIDANDSFLRMVQYERADVEAGLRWFDMTPPDWQEVHAREEAEELAATGKMQAREKEYFRKDGSRVPVLIGAACFEGQSRQGVAYILDLTERKRAEAALRDRERELSQLVDMVPSYLWRITPDGVPVFFNKRLVDFLGFDVTGADKPDRSRLDAFIEAAIHRDDALGVSEAFERSLASGERLSMKWRMRRADGVYRWMAASAEAMRDQDGGIAQWYGLCHDIDDQLQAEEALRNSKRQLEQMIEAVPFSLLSFDPSKKITYTSKRYLEQAGMPAEDTLDFDALARDVAHPEDYPVMFRRAQEGFATGQPFVNRFRRRLRNGGYRWIEARAQPLRDADGMIVQWYMASIDIEEEMRAQAALRDSERSLRALIETAPARSWCTSPSGEPTYFSRQFREFHGFNEAFRPSLSDMLSATVHPDDLDEVSSLYARCLVTGEPYMVRNRQRRFDGEYRWTLMRAIAMRNADGTIAQWNGICLDIEGEVRAQEELRAAQETIARAGQAASLAELSASIAHEVNQPLAAIMANSHACQRWLKGDPPNLERARITVERIIRDANSAADVVSRIRALFKQTVEPRNYTAFDGVIAEARNLMAEEAVRRHVRMDIDVEANLPLMAFDRVQIQQVLINLIRNGFEAMNSVAGEKVLGMRVRRIGDAVQTEISDRGDGIESLEKIFDPFFTTKRDGMGMGLAICRSIVESHGGRLWAARNEPHGAKLIFTLPIDAKAAA